MAELVFGILRWNYEENLQVNWENQRAQASLKCSSEDPNEAMVLKNE